MTKFTVRLLLKNKVLWAWPIIVLLVAVIAGWHGEIQSAGNSYSFLIAFGDSPPIPGGFIINGLIGFLILIAVIGVPTHFSKNLDPERASLILSKPVTRTEFFLSEFIGVLIVTVFYTLITDIILAVLLLAKAGIFPHRLYLAILLYIPLYFLAIYISIVLLLILTNSYLASVLIAYFFIVPLSGLLYRAEPFLGWDSELMVNIANGLSYIIPSTSGVERLMTGFNSPMQSDGRKGSS